jgi:hypothetical protein
MFFIESFLVQKPKKSNFQVFVLANFEKKFKQPTMNLGYQTEDPSNNGRQQSG